MVSWKEMFEGILFILYGVLLLAFGVGAWRLRYALKHFRASTETTTPSETKSLPSVTVCIPARNEMHAMTACLERVIASNYEKLEIIVLDDMSKDNTSTLIKSFAQDGVRFIEGMPLPDGWLGKNHALQGLLKEASGTYVLFLDVDTRISPDSVGQLVEYIQKENVEMVSVLPRREDGMRASVMLSTLRYFWELMFHRLQSPATASNAWMIRRQTLLDLKAFDVFKAAIQPESKLSAQLMAMNKYRFLIGSAELGVAYEKKWRSQVETSVRLLFPLLGGKVAHSIIAFLDLVILSAPLFVVLGGFICGWGLQQIIAGGTILLFAVLYGSYLKQVRAQGWLVGSLLWPLIVVQEALIVLVSAYRYETSRVTWKGRQVRSVVPKA